MSDGKRRMKHHFNREESSSSFDSDGEYAERNNYCRGDEPPPPDFYCHECKSTMNSNWTWNMHITGKKHIKKITSTSYRLRKQVKSLPGTITQNVKVFNTATADISTMPGKEPAYIQDDFERITDQAVLGLDFVNEIWRMDSSLGLAYFCVLCESECQPVTITKHVTGFRHRMRYLKHVDISTHERFVSSDARKSKVSEDLSRYAKKLEQQYGKGTVQVLHEVSVKSEESSEESEEEYRAPLPIVENPPSMESTLPRKISEQRDPGLAANAPIEAPPVPPKVIQLTNVQRKNISKSFETIEDPIRRAALLKTFRVDETDEDTVQEDLRNTTIDLYIKKKIEKMPMDTRRSMIQEYRWQNTAPLLEYFKVAKLAAAKDDLSSLVEEELRKD